MHPCNTIIFTATLQINLFAINWFYYSNQAIYFKLQNEIMNLKRGKL